MALDGIYGVYADLWRMGDEWIDEYTQMCKRDGAFRTPPLHEYLRDGLPHASLEALKMQRYIVLWGSLIAKQVYRILLVPFLVSCRSCCQWSMSSLFPAEEEAREECENGEEAHSRQT